MREACITDYAAVYARDYYAHREGASSFQKEEFGKKLLEEVGELQEDIGFLDIGGGNGTLADILKDLGHNCFTIDAQDRDGMNYHRVNLSVFDPAISAKITGIVTDRFRNGYVATCFDVAEHIDIEHLPDFLLNLNAFTQRDLFISISTRPSSLGNRFHSTILPSSTWKRLLEFAGFKVSISNTLQKGLSKKRWSVADENLWAVSHWQKCNPFREDAAHQVYFHCQKLQKTEDAPSLSSSVRQILDSDYRIQKRTDFETNKYLLFHISFWQDWAFLRSIMDVWPKDQMHVIIRSSFLFGPLGYIVRNYLTRVNVPFSEYRTVQQGISTIREVVADRKGILLNCTEGPPSPWHLASARVGVEARLAGLATVCLQHGLAIGQRALPSAETFWLWGSEFEQGYALADNAASKVEVSGSPKLLDASFAQSDGAFANRIGDWTSEYARVILISTGLHWNALQASEESVEEWIAGLCGAHPDYLFVLKPHPMDASVHSWATDRSNVMVLDDVLLSCMDWPVSRLLKSVDLVVTYPSTILLDAMAAGTPVAVYGADTFRGPINEPLKQLMSAAHSIGATISEDLFSPNLCPPSLSCLDESSRFLERLSSVPVDGKEKLPETAIDSRIIAWADALDPSGANRQISSLDRRFREFISSRHSASQLSSTEKVDVQNMKRRTSEDRIKNRFTAAYLSERFHRFGRSLRKRGLTK